MPKPACVACKRFYRPKRNGQVVLEQMPASTLAVPGLMTQAMWVPYKLWEADLWKCDGCGHELIVGYGREPMAELHENKFPDELRKARDRMIAINDC